MSSELNKYIENAVEKKIKLINAEVLDFPLIKKNLKKFRIKYKNYWKINDNSNSDQLKAVIGICLMFGFLFVIGLFANLTIV